MFICQLSRLAIGIRCAMVAENFLVARLMKSTNFVKFKSQCTLPNEGVFMQIEENVHKSFEENPCPDLIIKKHVIFLEITSFSEPMRLRRLSTDMSVFAV